jgi:hypothetical protein
MCSPLCKTSCVIGPGIRNSKPVRRLDMLGPHWIFSWIISNCHRSCPSQHWTRLEQLFTLSRYATLPSWVLAIHHPEFSFSTRRKFKLTKSNQHCSFCRKVKRNILFIENNRINTNAVKLKPTKELLSFTAKVMALQLIAYCSRAKSVRRILGWTCPLPHCCIQRTLEGRCIREILATLHIFQ